MILQSVIFAAFSRRRFVCQVGTSREILTYLNGNVQCLEMTHHSHNIFACSIFRIKSRKMNKFIKLNLFNSFFMRKGDIRTDTYPTDIENHYMTHIVNLLTFFSKSR